MEDPRSMYDWDKIEGQQRLSRRGRKPKGFVPQEATVKVEVYKPKSKMKRAEFRREYRVSMTLDEMACDVCVHCQKNDFGRLTCTHPTLEEPMMTVSSNICKAFRWNHKVADYDLDMARAALDEEGKN